MRIVFSRYRPYLKYLKPLRWYLLGGVLAGLVYAVASGAGLPLAAKVVLPLLFEDDSGSGAGAEDSGGETLEWFLGLFQSQLADLERETVVLIACAWLPAMFFLRAIGGYLNSYWITYCGYKLVEQLRDDVFVKLQALPVGFFQKHQSGDLLARITGDAEMLRTTMARIAQDLIKQPATLISALGILLYEAFQNEGATLVLFSILSIPICIIPLRIISRRLKKKAKALQAQSGALVGMLAETLQAPLEVRAYNLEGKFAGQFRTKVAEIVRSSMKMVQYQQMISPAVEVVAVSGLTVALYLGAQKADMTLSSFMVIAFAIFQCYEPIKKIGSLHSLLKQGEASIDRLEAITGEPDPQPECESARVPEVVRGELELRGVTFGYDPEEPVLKDISLKIKEGECVALVGPSGGGKSTFFSLLPRFYDVDSGDVLVSGLRVQDWKRKALRDQIAIVLQTPILFSGTIRENIELGRPGATFAEVQEAAQRADADRFIQTLPEGYETLVSEKGTSLSGGQRQRVSIARAFLKDAPILLLDEATSALDNESEARIQERLKELVKGRTTLLIAHRLSTTAIADRVVEIDNGRIVGERKGGGARP